MVSGDSLKRIAAAVQHYEHGSRSLKPVSLRTGPPEDESFPVRLGKISENWDKAATANVQEYSGSGEIITGSTFEAVNRFADVQTETESWVVCVLIGSTWHLIAAECG